MTPEGHEKKKVKAFLDSIGAYSHWPVQTGYGSATIDCLACVRGHFLGIEVKKAGYKPSDFTDRQRITMQRINESAGATFSGDAEEIKRGIAKWLLDNGFLSKTVSVKP